MESIQEMCDFFDSKKEEINLAFEIDSSEAYKLIISYGENLLDFPEVLMVPENKVRGCVSNVFIHAEYRDGGVYYNGHTDSQIVRGFLAIMVEAFSGLSPREIVQESEECINRFLLSTNIKATLTPTRANAFSNIYCLMKEKAAFFISK